MLELLTQLDRFETSNKIKVLMATNRVDILDQAHLRPGRIDRKIEFLNPNKDAWAENQRSGYSKKKRPECIDQLQKKHKRMKLPNTITIDSIYEKNFLSLTSVFEAVIVDAFLLPGTNFYMLTSRDFWSSNTIDLYLHRRSKTRTHAS